jgi:hypothetical protein
MNNRRAATPDNGLGANNSGYTTANEAPTTNQLKGVMKSDADLSANKSIEVSGRCLSERVVTLNRALLINGNNQTKKIQNNITWSVEVLPFGN